MIDLKSKVRSIPSYISTTRNTTRYDVEMGIITHLCDYMHMHLLCCQKNLTMEGHRGVFQSSTSFKLI